MFRSVVRGLGIFGGNVLLLTNTVEQLVVTVGHDHVHSDQVVHGPEAASRHVALHRRDKSTDCSSGLGHLWIEFRSTHLVLDGLVAPHGGHVLRHDETGVAWTQASIVGLVEGKEGRARSRPRRPR